VPRRASHPLFEPLSSVTADDVVVGVVVENPQLVLHGEGGDQDVRGLDALTARAGGGHALLEPQSQTRGVVVRPDPVERYFQVVPQALMILRIDAVVQQLEREDRMTGELGPLDEILPPCPSGGMGAA